MKCYLKNIYLNLVYKNRLHYSTTISKSVCLRNVEIGANGYIGPFVNAYGCFIGSFTKIGSSVEIQSDVTIGNNVTISSHTFICSKVTIEDEVFVGHGVMTINDLYPPSKKRTGSADWRSIKIGKGSVIGSNATILPVNIAPYSFVAAGSLVNKNTRSFMIVAGNPCQELKPVPPNVIPKHILTEYLFTLSEYSKDNSFKERYADFFQEHNINL
jgi:UDP-2-acetamido-3-amino-2,3-dideoxy-glucuronate N-acetyltransferase